MNKNAFNDFGNLRYQYQYSDIEYIGKYLIKNQQNHNLIYASPLTAQEDEDGMAVDPMEALKKFTNDINGGHNVVGIFNTGGNHWIAYILFKHEEQIKCWYKDSLGQQRIDFESTVKNAFNLTDQVVKAVNNNKEQNIDFEPVANYGIRAHVSCGVFALKNMLILGGLEQATLVQANAANVAFFTPGTTLVDYDSAIKNTRTEFGKMFLCAHVEEAKNTQIRKLAVDHHANEAISLKNVCGFNDEIKVDVRSTLQEDPLQYRYGIKYNDANKVAVTASLSTLGIVFVDNTSDKIIYVTPQNIEAGVEHILDPLKQLITSNATGFNPAELVDSEQLVDKLEDLCNITVESEALTKEVLAGFGIHGLDQIIHNIASCKKQAKSATNASQKANLKEDLSRLEEIFKLIKIVEQYGIITDIDQTLSHLEKIGNLFFSISHDEKNKDCIRNAHGYRNPYKSQEKNSTGANLDFVGLSYLEHIKTNEEFKKVALLCDLDLVKQSLEMIQQKVKFILYNKSESLTESQKLLIKEYSKTASKDLDFAGSENVGFLRTMAYYYHDKKCIDTLLSHLAELEKEYYKSLDLNIKEDKYALGYFFVQFGEIAKDVSDFIKPETSGVNSLTRDLFTKLLHLRNIVKENPATAHDMTNHQLLQMKLIFDKVGGNLEDILKFIKSKIDSYIVCKDGTDNIDVVATVDKINTYYPQFNQSSAGQKFSTFEEHIYDKILELITMLDAVPKELPINISSTQDSILEIKAKISKLDSNINRLQSALVQDDSAHHTETPKQKLLKVAKTAEAAKQVINLSKQITQDQTQDGRFSSEHKALIKAIRDTYGTQTPKKAIPNQALERLAKSISGYQTKLDSAISEVQEVEQNAPQIDAHTCRGMKDLFTWIDSADYNADKINVEYTESRIKTLQKKRSITHKELQVKEACVAKLTAVQSDLDASPPPIGGGSKSVASTSSSLTKFQALLTQVIKETEFLQLLYSKLEKDSHSNTLTPEQLHKLALATKMSFSFIGEAHKRIQHHNQKELDDVLVSRSMLIEDCFEVIQIRHKALMHNIVHNAIDVSSIISTVKDDIIPWLKDFYAILALSDAKDMESYATTLKDLMAHFPDKNPNEIELGLIHNIMSCLNRLTKYDEVIKIFDNDNTQKLMQSDNNVITQFLILDVVASSLYCKGDYSRLQILKTLQLGLLAKDDFAEEKYSNLKARVHYETSVCEGKLGNSALELSNLDSAKSLATNYYTKQIVVSGFGNYHFGKQEYDEAVDSFKECLKQIESKKISDPNDCELMLNCYLGLHVSYGEKKCKSKSIDALKKAEEIITSQGVLKTLHGEFYQNDAARFYTYKAGDFREQGYKEENYTIKKEKYREALREYLKALQCYTDKKLQNSDLANLHLQIGNCWRDLKNYNTAQTNLETAEKLLADLYGNGTVLLDMGHIKAALSCVYKHLGNSVKAKQYHDQALQIFDSNVPEGKYYKQVQIKNWEALNSFHGHGSDIREQENYISEFNELGYSKWFNEYYSEGIDKILLLRKDTLVLEIKEKIKILSAKYQQSSFCTDIDLLVQDIYALRVEDGDVILVPYNIENKHWVGLVFEKYEGGFRVIYLDPENKNVNLKLLSDLERELESLGQKLEFYQRQVETQKYSNCGVEVVENFMLYLTGKRIDQESAVAIHSILLEDVLTIIGESAD